MSSKKQTAVDWIIEMIIPSSTLPIKTINEFILQAKAIEKEQIKDSYADGVARHLHDKVILSEQYYEETYEQ